MGFVLASALPLAGCSGLVVPGTRFVKGSGGEVSCDPGYVKVAAAEGNPAFCVAKYEMKLMGNDDPWTEFLSDGLTYFNRVGVAESRASGRPWSGLSRDTALATCRALGRDYDLISNAQWIQLGHEIESEASNWSAGSVAQGRLNRGHSEGSPSEPLAAGDDSNPCFGITGDVAGCAADSWHVLKRTHRLGSGEVVWDLSGNLMEWVRDDLDVGAEGFLDSMSFDDQRFLGALYPSAADSGFGYVFSGTGVAIRGGLFSWDMPEYNGIYALDLGGRNLWADSGSDGTVGFRCVHSWPQ
jgi:hypothetical protein